MALLRYRMPAFCRVVNRLHGELAERIFEQLFLHGLMRLVGWSLCHPGWVTLTYDCLEPPAFDTHRLAGNVRRCHHADEGVLADQRLAVEL